MTSIVWFRQDLRLADQAAVAAAASEGPWIGVYVLDDAAPGQWATGGAQRWWLHHSLTELATAIAGKGGRLVLRKGDSVTELSDIATTIGTKRVHAIRHYEPWWQKAEAALAERLDLKRHDGGRLAPPDRVRTGSGGRYRVFTPYWRALKDQMPPPLPLQTPEQIVVPDIRINSNVLSGWALLPANPDWSTGFDVWTPGEEGARAALRDFLPKLEAYDETRNLPSIEGISRLSPHLHFGEISPATVWHHAARKARSAAEPWLRQVGWRDFAANVIDISPKYGCENGRDLREDFAWRDGPAADRDFRAWTKGQTGYPIVDAGMRELWATGVMHNRVRMIAASFLIKHLLIDWRRGERWFWDTLLDADYGSNAVNWQWVAGTESDSNPFGRIMAPLLQSRKFDAGDYIRRWVPELAQVEGDAVHDPHEAGIAVPGYPAPLIGHREARARALAAIAGN